jgi:transcriptional regulator with XRE-family HTH domain
MPRVSRLQLPPLDLGEETIDQRIARLRKERGYTQAELADRIRIIQTLVSAYEHDQLRLNAEMLARFPMALEVSADEVLSLERVPAGTAKPKPSLRLLRRLQRIEALSPTQQKSLLQTIDMSLKAAGK